MLGKSISNHVIFASFLLDLPGVEEKIHSNSLPKALFILATQQMGNYIWEERMAGHSLFTT